MAWANSPEGVAWRAGFRCTYMYTLKDGSTFFGPYLSTEDLDAMEGTGSPSIFRAPKPPPRPKNRAERRKHLQDAWQIKAHLDTI